MGHSDCAFTWILNGGRQTSRSRHSDRLVVLWQHPPPSVMAEFDDESFKEHWRNTGTLKWTCCMSCSWLHSPSNSWLSRKVYRKSDRRPNQAARICALSSMFNLVVSASGNKSPTAACAAASSRCTAHSPPASTLATKAFQADSMVLIPSAGDLISVQKTILIRILYRI